SSPTARPTSAPIWPRCCWASAEARRASAHLFDLAVFEIDRGLAAEDHHRHFETAALFVDFRDHAFEALERAVRDLHPLADFEMHQLTRLGDAGFGDAAEDALDFAIAHRLRLLLGAEKAGHFRRVLDQVIGLVAHHHLHQHVAGEVAMLAHLLGPAHDFGDFLGRHLDVFEMILEPLTLGLLADRFSHLLL